MSGTTRIINAMLIVPSFTLYPICVQTFLYELVGLWRAVVRPLMILVNFHQPHVDDFDYTHDGLRAYTAHKRTIHSSAL